MTDAKDDEQAMRERIRAEVRQAQAALLAANRRVAQFARAMGDVAASRADVLAAAGTSASQTAAGFARNLDWDGVGPLLKAKFAAAGARGELHGEEGARAVWESLPQSLRVMGDSKVSAVLHGKDWSHIKPHSHGGSADAANGVFEAASINRARGAEDMGLPDLATAKAQLHAAGIKSAASAIGASALRGAGIAAVSAVLGSAALVLSPHLILALTAPMAVLGGVMTVKQTAGRVRQHMGTGKERGANNGSLVPPIPEVAAP